MGRLSSWVGRNRASEWEKPGGLPEQDTGSWIFFVTPAEPEGGALVALAGRLFGETEFHGDFGLGETIHCDTEDQGGVVPD